MVSMRWRHFLGIALAVLAIPVTCTYLSAAETEVENNEPNWSADSNGLRARLHLRYSHVINGTGIIVSHLELQNVSNTSTPMLVTVDRQSMSFSVVDSDGNDLPMPGTMFFNGKEFGTPELVLPHDSSIRFRIGPCGRGIPGDQASQVDLGIQFGWVLPHDGKKYYLHAVLEIPKLKKDSSASGVHWNGHLKIPPVLVPTEPVSVDPSTVGQLINDLGTKMLLKNGDESEAAVRELSLIDDPRVIPWYVKAVKTDSYSLKFSALDRLSRIEGDDALAGLMIGIATQGNNMGNVTKAELAEGLAESIRLKAVHGLTRSPHPKAKELLFSMHEDPAMGVRLTVIQAVAKMDTPESLALLKSHIQDSDATVRQEVDRLLQLRNQDE